VLRRDVPNLGDIMTTREKFVERFGEPDAARIESAAQFHRAEDGPYAVLARLFFGDAPHEHPADPFLLDLSTCISWECLSEYRVDHGIEAAEEELRDWIRDNVTIPESLRDPCGARRYGEYQRWFRC
jgi:hypothetical protein